MAEIVSFQKASKKHLQAKQKNKPGNTLCLQGHHKWLIVQDKQFDTQKGKLVTLYECQRCQKRKSRLL